MIELPHDHIIDLGRGESCTVGELDSALRRAYGFPRGPLGEADVLIAWAAGEVSEGTAAALLGMDRVAARARLARAVARGARLARRDVRATIRGGRTERAR